MGGENTGRDFILGLDFGTDSCRALIVDAANGQEAGSQAASYDRWGRGLYCDSGASRFRQHPLDYLEALEEAVQGAAAQAGPEAVSRIRAVGLDTTGSTPCAVDRQGRPLSLQPGFAENPSAMFVLWKDHTANAEAAEINALAKTWGGVDFTRYEGGAHASEWFWSKALRILREDPSVAAELSSFLEHCDWMTGLLCGESRLDRIKRSRGVMGHKGLWHPSFAEGSGTDKPGTAPSAKGGYPAPEFLARLDKRLVPLRETLGTETWTGETLAGALCPEWARKLGLPPGIPVAAGAVDCYMGAVGGGVESGRLLVVAGTSTCIMTVTPRGGEERLVRGLCGQIEGSMVDGLLGYESGQSAFGDVYAWFRKLLLWPLENLLPPGPEKERLLADTARRIIPELEKRAALLRPGESGILALDWFNGRRSPDLAPALKAAITGLSLGTDAPRLYRALAEGTVFGSRAILDRFLEEGVPVRTVTAVGGVARKSSLVMQIMADVFNLPVEVSSAPESAALGSAMCAAVAAGLYPNLPTAQRSMAAPIEKVYTPDPGRVSLYRRLYQDYQTLGTFAENFSSKV